MISRIKKFCYILLSAALSLVGLISCHKYNQNQYPTQILSQQDLNINPYSGKDTLLFMNSTGDSIALTGIKRETEQECRNAGMQNAGMQKKSKYNP